MSDLISLIVGGKPLDKDWSDIRVRRSMENMCSSFDFICTQGQPFNYRQWPITMGASCEVRIGDTRVLKGWIEDINVDYDKDSHTVQVAGRDVTCDLVDCHKADKQYGYEKTTVKRVVEDTCRPFGIPVKIDPSASMAANTIPQLANLKDAPQFANVFWAPGGDSLIGIIYRITRLAKLFVIASDNGELLLTTAGARSATMGLMSGVNILKGGLKQSDKERFSVYYVKGFGTETEGLVKSGEWLWLNGTYRDTTATRYRPYSNMAETSINLSGVGWRSKAEAQYRIGNSRRYSYTVQGWREKEGGDLWQPNSLVIVDDPLFGLDTAQLLVESVDYTQTDQGTTTALGLCSPEKYRAQAELNKIKTVFEQAGKG